MDNINRLLSLNIEIEGMLRVLADRQNDLARQLLLNKSEEFVTLVHEAFDSTTPPCASIDDTSPTLSADNKEVADCSPHIAENVITESPIQATVEENNSEAEDAHTPEEILIEEDAPSDFLINIDPDATSSTEFISAEQQPEKVRIDEMLSRREASDLSKAFTLNDRFRFQRALFGGSRDDFNAFITGLAKVSSYSEAMTRLSQIAEIDEDDPDVCDFLTILQNHFNA